MQCEKMFQALKQVLENRVAVRENYSCGGGLSKT